jgi:multiple sugar transport system substrate-binding protein
MQRIHTAIALLLLPLLFLSCGKTDGVVELQLWNFGGTPPMMEWVRQRVDAFNASQTRIRVVQSQKSWNMIRELLYTNMSAGTGPDVMNVHANYAAEFGGAGFFYPINTFADFEEVKAIHEPNLFTSVQYGGNTYGLPTSSIAFVLVCNKEMFDAEGIAPPRTWSEFKEASKRLTKDTDGDGSVDQWGFVIMGGDRGGFAYRMAAFLYKGGANILTDDLTGVGFNSEAGLRTLELLAEMYQVDKSITPGFLAYQLSEITDLFCSDRVGMSLEGPWFRVGVEQKSPGKDFYTVPVPVPDDLVDRYDTLPTLQDMVMYSINANTEHLKESWEFAKFMRNEEADMYWVRRNLGAYPTTRNAFASPEAEKIRDFAMYRNELQHARPWPPHPAIISIARNALTPWAQKAIVGEVSPEEAMKRAAEEAEKILAEIQ